MSLAEKNCEPCRGGTPPLSAEQIKEFLPSLHKDWRLNSDGHIIRLMTVGDFKSAMHIATQIAVLADEQNHHPDLHIGWGKCLIELWTHKINGLSEADFVMAAKIDRLV